MGKYCAIISKYDFGGTTKRFHRFFSSPCRDTAIDHVRMVIIPQIKNEQRDSVFDISDNYYIESVSEVKS